MGSLEPRSVRPRGVWKGPRHRILTKRPGEVLVWRLKSGGTRRECWEKCSLQGRSPLLAHGNTYPLMVWVTAWVQVKGPQPAAPGVLACHGLPGTC